jgi:transposase
MALPQVVMNHVKKQAHHHNIYVLDRGLQSTKNMDAFTQKDITFVCRAKENRKYVELGSLILPDQELDLGDTTLIKDAKVQLYTGQAKKSKKETSYYQQTIVAQEFRMIIIESKSDHKQYVFLTNDFKRPAREIAQAYRRRWDIEIFFRFLKQELNVSHLISLNKNGIQVMLYMTLIVAMMVLIYKKANGLSYKTAKRRFAIEVRNLAIAMIVVRCGGNPDLMFKT